MCIFQDIYAILAMTLKVFWVMFIFLIFGTCKSAVVIYIAYRQGTFIMRISHWPIKLNF